jgi:hypothetical protein
MLIDIFKIGPGSNARVMIELHTRLEKNEESLLPEGNTYVDLPLPNPIPIPFYKNAHGSIPAAVKWKPSGETETPIAYKPFFFPRNPTARLQEHYPNRTALYLRLPGKILLGYVNRIQIPQFELWFQSIELLIPQLFVSTGNIDLETQAQTIQPVIRSKIETRDKSLETGIGIRALEL